MQLQGVRKQVIETGTGRASREIHYSPAATALYEKLYAEYVARLAVIYEDLHGKGRAN
jgi:hypothetical protein